jgi:hypothetical protein
MTSFADVVNAYDGGRYWQYEIRKIAGSVASNRWFDLAYTGGLPLANYYASTPLEVAFLDGKRGMYKGSPNTGQKYVHKIAMSAIGTNNSNVNFTLLDYVAYVPFIDLDSTDQQYMIWDVDLPRYADGKGLRVMAISQGVGTSVTNLTMTYINQDGVEMSATTTLDTSAHTVGGLLQTGVASTSRMWLNLAQGDSGIRKIISVTNSTSTGGLCALVIVKPVSEIGLCAIGEITEVDYMFERTRMPMVHNDAYLNFICSHGHTAAITPSFHGYVNFIWES